MSESPNADLDMRELIANALREYEDVIAHLIERPAARPIEAGPGIGMLALDGGLPSEPSC